MMDKQQADAILWRHIRDLPYFRAMLRAVEDSFYQEIKLDHPMLDLGCGDGHFASVAFQDPPEIGADPWREPIEEARGRALYQMIVQSDGASMPFPDGWFASVASTSVLEHIPHIDAVLHEVGRVTRPGGTFVFCVPNQRFPEKLLGVKFFQAIGLRGLAKRYSIFFNRIARHAHTDGPEEWTRRLEEAGFSVERHWDYFSPSSLYILETGHLFGMPSWFIRKITGRWILSKSRLNLWLPFQLCRPAMDQRLSPEGVCTFYIAKRNIPANQEAR